MNYDADICYAVFAFISKKRGGGGGGGGCEYPSPFVVTNCGTLGAKEERGVGAQKMYSHVNVSHIKWKLALSNEMLQQKQAVYIQTL